MHVSRLVEKEPNPTSVAFVEACLELGYPANDDFNGERLEGAGFNPVSIKKGRRQSAGVAFIEPVLDRPNLDVRTNSQVARLVFEGRRCVGVELLDGERLEAGEEVVVCAGAIDSPRILIISGIGPADELRRLDVEVVQDLPGVGQNLHDHLLLGVVYEASQPVPAGKNNLSESQLFWRSDPRLLEPDIQIALVHVPFHSPEFEAPENSYTIAPGIVRPLSRGSLRVLEARPDGQLEIDPNYLAEEADVDGLLRGIEMSREIGEAAAFAPWRKREVLPGPEVTSHDGLREFAQKAASTYYHPVGTCKMGPDSMSVVDHELRVHGVEGLRVADGSIMPAIVSSNPNAAITMIGYKAAAMLAGLEAEAGVDRRAAVTA
jgi:choline dehydrogenase